MKNATRRSIGLAAAGIAAAGAAGVAAAARREQTSIRGWLASYLLVPALYGRRKGGHERFHVAIADSRANGPALPSAKVRARYRFSDEGWEGERVFRLAPKEGPKSRLRILYIHGGAYVFDLMPVQWPVMTGLVDRTGAEVVASIYPLAPEHHVDEGLMAVEKVYRKLVDEVGSNNVVVAGDSAGGGLTLALAQRLRDSGQKTPAALVLLFPWLDVTCSGTDQPEMIANEPLLSVDELRTAGRMWAGDSDPAGPLASPLFAQQDGLPPTLILVGTRDMLLSDSRRFKELQPSATLHEYTGMFHGWICAPIPEAGRAIDQTAAFAQQHTGAR